MYKVIAWCSKEVDWVTLIETSYRDKAYLIGNTYAEIDYYSVIEVYEKQDDGQFYYLDGWTVNCERSSG